MGDLGAQRCDSMSTDPIRLAPGRQGGERQPTVSRRGHRAAPKRRRRGAVAACARAENDDLATTSARGTRVASSIWRPRRGAAL